MSGPYQFGDVVDGYRWTVLGWEPVEGSEPAASAALQHALDTHLERPALTRHARHVSAAAHRPAATTPPDDEVADAADIDLADIDPAAVDVAEPVPAPEAAEDSVEAALPAQQSAPASGSAPDPAPATGATPQLRWTPVGWEVVAEDPPVEPTAPSAPVDTRVDLVEGDRPTSVSAQERPEAPPLEEFADVVAAAPSAPPLEAEDGATEVIDLREPERAITLPEPSAGWYPG
jgi:hypothetical protein